MIKKIDLEAICNRMAPKLDWRYAIKLFSLNWQEVDIKINE